jgi:aryl-alcohol dehydrogenase-like predicted oxidoreductase
VETRELGKSGVRVSVIGMGCWVIADEKSWGHVEEDEAVATVREALDLGVNFFDTAEAYGWGRSEELLGRALAGRRAEAVIATKAVPDHLSAKELPRALEGSLKRLGTDYIDLYYAHWPSRSIPFDETMRAMERLREQGKVRAIGVSNFGAGDLEELVKPGVPDANQLPYGLFWRAIEPEILPKCAEQGISVVAYGPLAMGLLTGKFKSLGEVPESNRRQTRLFKPDSFRIALEAVERLRPLAEEVGTTLAGLALAWAAAQPGVASVIPGAKNRKQLRENAKAADVRPSEGLLRRTTEVSEPLFRHLGTDPDMWDMGRFR